MDISFILVEPVVPENIGSAARALNTMGFSDLRLVNPANHLADEAKWLAHGSNEILEQAKIFHHFDEAIADLDFIIGTTAKKRSAKYDYYTPEQARVLVEKKTGIVSKIGIVFGSEESGLKNEELAVCDIASTIQLAKPYPSINLAQSVMLYGYVFSALQSEVKKNLEAKQDDTKLYRELKNTSMDILQILHIEKGSNLYHRILERLAIINADDARLFLSFAKKFKQKFE